MPSLHPCAPAQDKSTTLAVPSADPEAEERRRREAEEARLAEMRAHGHAVTPEAFAEVRGNLLMMRLMGGVYWKPPGAPCCLCLCQLGLKELAREAVVGRHEQP